MRQPVKLAPIPWFGLRLPSGRVWGWSEPMYGVDVVLFSCSYAHYASFCRGLGLNVLDRDKDNEPSGSSFLERGRPSMIWIPATWSERSADDINTLVHECMHLTMTALLYRGVNADMDHEEPYCYFMGWLVEQCLVRLRTRCTP